MADHIVSLEYPSPVNWARWTRNGMIPTAHFFRWCVREFSNVAQLRKQLVFSHTQDFASIETAESSTHTRWRFRFRSGYASHRLVFAMLLGLEDHATATDPYCYWALTEVGVGTTNSTEMRYGQSSGGPDDTPDEWMWTSVSMDISPNTEYECVLQTVDYSRPVACGVWERGALTGLDDTLTGAVDPTKFALGQPILDDDMAELGEASRYLWKQNGSQLFTWSAEDTGATAVPTSTSTSYVNMFDSTSTPGATTVGVNIQTTYHNTDTETDLPVEFAVYAEYDSAFAGTGSIKISDGTNEIEITGISTPAWYTATGTIPAALAKFDLMGKMADASGTATKLWAAQLSEWES